MLTLYKSLKADLKSHGDYTWKVGEWRKVEGKIEACKNGFHASKNIIDAMRYVNMECLALVEVKGKSDKSEKDKEAWSEMRIKKAWKWEKKDSVALSIFAAELCLKNFEKVFPDDKRPREAIEAAKKWLLEPTAANESAAESAAEAAAWSLARAESAAEAAAWSAVAAAWSAWSVRSVRSAAAVAAWVARSAWSAASEKILKKCHDWILKRTKELTEIK